MNITQETILGQLKENTGRHMLDSGGAYGRSWERNQKKTWDDLVKGPITTRASLHNGCVDFEYTISLAAWMDANLEFCQELQTSYEAWCKKQDPDNDMHDMQCMEQFAALHDKHAYTDNTYNGECDLSQTIQYVQFNWEEEDGCERAVVLLQVHGGCDVRGGYTSPKAYEIRGGEGYLNPQCDGFASGRHYWDRDGYYQGDDDHIRNMHDYPAVECVHVDMLETHLEALKSTAHDNEQTRELMRSNNERVKREAFEDFCGTLGEPHIVVHNKEAWLYTPNPDSQTLLIQATCSNL